MSVLRVSDAQIEWDENGCNLVLTVWDGDEDEVESFKLDDPAEFYKTIRHEIEPWLREMKAARREFDRERRAGAVFHNAPDDNEEPDWDAVRDSARGK